MKGRHLYTSDLVSESTSDRWFLGNLVPIFPWEVQRCPNTIRKKGNTEPCKCLLTARYRHSIMAGVPEGEP